MGEYKLATYAAGVAGLTLVSTLLTTTRAEPYPAPFHEVADNSEKDQSGAPVGMGKPWCEWNWDWLPQADFNILYAYATGEGTPVYIRTRLNDGSWASYKATMQRPTGDPLTGSRRENVKIVFLQLEAP